MKNGFTDTQETTVFKFKLIPQNDALEKVYLSFLQTLGLRRYSFSVEMECKSSALTVAVVTVKNWEG